MTLATGYSCRAMALEDVGELTEIERQCFGLPWTRQMFLNELEYPYGWRHVVVGIGGGVAGYIICRFYGDLWHVMDLATRADHRRRGIAGHLLDEFLRQTGGTHVPSTLEVRVSNAVAISLYQSRGFREVGKRPGYYHDTHEDALVMERPSDGA